MRCSAYCTAASYKLDDLAKHLNNQGQEPQLYDQVIHAAKLTSSKEKNIFYFSYGAVVFWNYTEGEELLILQELEEFEQDHIELPSADVCYYTYSEEAESKTYIKEEEDIIVLESDDNLIKLALSYGLSQSVKLSTFENVTGVTIEKTRYLVEELCVHGKTSLSRKKLTQMIGALFAERNSINLHSDILDTPEFFWRRPRYEVYYLMASDYLDIDTRLDILNRRLAVIHELYEMLSNELKHIHASHLELIIVGLIVIEVVLTIIDIILMLNFEKLT